MLLALPQLILGPLALGDVFDHGKDVDRLALSIVNKGCG